MNCKWLAMVSPVIQKDSYIIIAAPIYVPLDLNRNIF